MRKYGLRVEPGSLPGAVYRGVGRWMDLAGGAWACRTSHPPVPQRSAPSPGWRWAGMALVGFIIIRVLTVGLTPGPMTNAGYESVNNPLGVADSLRGLLVIVSGIAGFGILISVLACSVSMIVRFRHSRGIEREQVKWLAYAASLIAGLGVIEIVLEATNPTGITARTRSWHWQARFPRSPIAAGIANSALPPL